MAIPPPGGFDKRLPKVEQVVDLRVEVFVGFAHSMHRPEGLSDSIMDFKETFGTFSLFLRDSPPTHFVRGL